MSKILKSGNVYMGTCGDPTDLYDGNGNHLKVGDLVAVWTQEISERGWNDAPTFVVREKDGRPYIMGLKNAERIREYIHDGEPSDAEHCDTVLDSYRCKMSTPDPSKAYIWNVVRVKPYDAVAPGETWEGVSMTDEDTETELEDGITTCCGYDFGMDQFDDTIRFCPKCGRRIHKKGDTLSEKKQTITREFLDERYSLSSYNENTKEQMDYYIDERACKKGDKAYLYSRENDALEEMTILHCICRSDDPQAYDQLLDNEDVLLDGEDEYDADTSAEFITDHDCYLVWFRRPCCEEEGLA